MSRPCFVEGSFDLIWAEGSIYITGFATGLRRWRPLLKDTGCLAATELSWLKQEASGEAAAFWQKNYP
jgi:hypothetical protein